MTCVVPLLACRRHVSWTRRDVACRPDVSDPTDPRPLASKQQKPGGPWKRMKSLRKFQAKPGRTGVIQLSVQQRAAPVTYYRSSNLCFARTSELKDSSS